MIRVLIAEDSATCLGLLTELIGSDPELSVVATATHGAEAVTMTRDLRPDVVVMDIHMPVMDGFEATQHIMTDAPTPIVIVSATLDVREVSVSMHALRMGALAVMAKPSLTGGDLSEMTRQFTATIRAMSQVRVVRRWHTRSSLPPIVTRTPPPARNTPVQVLAIAASTGGPGALYRILSELPTELDVPIMVVQHIASGFIGGLAMWLDAVSQLRVKVAEQGEHLAPGTVYLAPDELHMGMTSRGTIELSSAPPIDGFKPSANHLFESVARVCGPAALSLILTGMGEDGCSGLRAVHAAGGRVIAQDEETSIVYGMPGAAVGAGLAHAVLPLHMIAPRLARLIEKNPIREGTSA